MENINFKSFLIFFMFSKLIALSPLDKANAIDLKESGDSSIYNIEKEKIYLNPDFLIIQANRLYLTAESGEEFLIPTLYSNTNGYYVINQRIETPTTVYPIISCRNCGKRFSPTIFNGGKCPSCYTQN